MIADTSLFTGPPTGNTVTHTAAQEARALGLGVAKSTSAASEFETEREGLKAFGVELSKERSPFQVESKKTTQKSDFPLT